MEDWSILFLIIWIGCFLVVSIDSAYKKISPVFWRVASLFGGLFRGNGSVRGHPDCVSSNRHLPAGDYVRSDE